MEKTPSSRYHLSVHRAEGAYFARVLEIPGCISHGHSEVEAVENARIAIRLHRHAMKILDPERAIAHVEISA